MTLTAAIADALALHRAGRLREAAALYAAILRDDPHEVDAPYYLAMIAMQEGRFTDGIAAAEQALAKGPPQARLYNLIGQALMRTGRPAEAAANFERAIALDSAYAEAHGNRANALADLGRRDEALAAFDRALALRPDSPEDWCNRAAVLADLGRAAEALDNLDRALALQPDWPQAHFNRGNALKDLSRREEALAAYDRALALNPDFFDALTNSGFALRDLGRLDEALARLGRAAALRPGRAEPLQHHANVLREAGRHDEAAGDYARALAIDPQLANAHVGLGLLRLTHGDWENGWRRYEHRDRMPEPAYVPLPHRRWNGEALAGERLVLLAEQGLGDVLQFCRFAPLLAARGFDVTLLAPETLRPLLSSLAGVTIATSADELARDPRPLRWLPLMSVPHVLGLRPDNVPAPVPYLAAEPERIAAWASRLPDGFKVGINWAVGYSLDWYRRKRSIPLAAFAPLAALPGVRLIALQKGTGTEQADTVEFRSRIETPGPDFDSGNAAFLDTAAIMATLDLVVTCDTSVAHLAGALGRPVFAALPIVADWRWGLNREDTPWYPTMRLFRQSAPGDWAGVFARIAAAVAETAARV